MAFTNTAATIPGIIVPVFVGKLTHSDVSSRWQKTFWFTINRFTFSSRQSDHGESSFSWQLRCTSLRSSPTWLWRRASNSHGMKSRAMRRQVPKRHHWRSASSPTTRQKTMRKLRFRHSKHDKDLINHQNWQHRNTFTEQSCLLSLRLTVNLCTFMF